ncbi:DegT/DnrJ/EryC1/StrS family aminotransferase [Planctomycetota bacterium]
MYRIGQKEIDAIAKVLLSGKVFRYNIGGECGRFERRYEKYLGVKHVMMTSSGTTALTAALVGLGIGPGDEVLVPACTYMASAVSVLAAGAIPVIADIDESITLSPEAVADAIGPRTRAVMPVHMWGLCCDMAPLMRVARKKKVLVVEDCCQCVGGAYRGKKVGSFGQASGFSFNYYKNMTSGEGGAAVTNSAKAHQRIRCMVDCCSFYWTGREADLRPFTSNGARASEVEGAMMNAQLDRLDGMIRALRRQKTRILKETADTGLQPIKANSLDWECGSHVMYILPTTAQAEQFARLVGCGIAGKTGRHVYTEWDQIFGHRGAHHPALNPYDLAENKACRMDYTKDMCAPSLDILNRTVMLGNHPDRRRPQVTALIRKIKAAAKEVLSSAD